jgi:membrane protease subunit (stomatin/prohibitin family)
MSLLRKLEVIQFFDETGRSLVARVPQSGSAAIQLGAQLIVHENQEAIFFRDGQALDAFGAGHYTLTTANVPLITAVLTTPWEKSPFQCQVYFVGKQTFIDQKWGTRQPIPVTDSRFGMVRLRAFGKFAYRVENSKLFLDTLVGTQGRFTTDSISDYLKDRIVSSLADLMATARVPLLELAMKYDEIAAGTRAKVAADFAKYGLELTDFFINAITAPEEVQRAIDAASSMGAIGDMRAFTMYQAARSMEKMAENGGAGGAAGPMQMGMGAGFGMMLPGMVYNSMQGYQPGPAGGAPQNMPPASGMPRGAASSAAAGPAATAGVVAATVAGGSDFGELAPIVVDPRQLVRGVAQASGWNVDEAAADDWKITVPIGATRKQVVHVKFSQKDEGHDILAFTSICGPATDKNAMALLRYNTKMVHGAFAVDKTEAGEMIVLRANQLADTADPLEVTRAITAIAWQADKVEGQLLGGNDQH